MKWKKKRRIIASMNWCVLCLSDNTKRENQMKWIPAFGQMSIFRLSISSYTALLISSFVSSFLCVTSHTIWFALYLFACLILMITLNKCWLWWVGRAMSDYCMFAMDLKQIHHKTMKHRTNIKRMNWISWYYFHAFFFFGFCFVCGLILFLSLSTGWFRLSLAFKNKPC